MKRDILVLILVILLGYRINLVGSISLTELYVILQIPTLCKWMNNLHFSDLKKLRNMFIMLLFSQIFSEFLLRNSWQNAVKGLMITIMTFFIILFFMREIIAKRVSLITIPLGMMLSLLIFGDQFGYAESGDGNVFFKFYIVPLIMNGACIIFLLNKKWINKNIVLIFLGASMFMMIGGSRTGGFTMLLSLMLYLAAKQYKQLSWSKFLKVLVPLLIVGELFYAFIYVPKVKSGEWGSEQNRTQMATIDYSRNGLMLIMAARHDFFVSLVAFMDKPLLGHGAWAKDETLKYALLSAELADEDERKVINNVDYQGYPLVPIHSILVGMGTRNGILAFLLFFSIFVFVYKRAFSLLLSKPYALPYVCYLIIASIQAVLFSPPAILKGNIAVMWAILMALYYFEIQNKNKLSTKQEDYEIINSDGNV